MTRLFAISVTAVAIMALSFPVLAQPPETPKPARLSLALAAATTGTTALIHGIFFGAGRYGLVIVPALVLAAAVARWPFDTAPQNPDD